MDTHLRRSRSYADGRLVCRRPGRRRQRQRCRRDYADGSTPTAAVGLDHQRWPSVAMPTLVNVVATPTVVNVVAIAVGVVL
jgi:hypothetical protein